MRRKIALYLAGSIQKGHEKNDESYWTEDHMTLLRQELSDYDLSFLNPAFRTDDLSDQRSVLAETWFRCHQLMWSLLMLGTAEDLVWELK